MDFGVESPEPTSATTPGAWTDQRRPAVAFGARSESLSDQLSDRLAQLAQFRAGWDGHRASPVSRTIIYYACNLIPRIVSTGVPVPFIAPLPFGGMQLEWHRNGWDLEIEIHAPDRLYVYTRELATGRESEMNLRDDLSGLAQVLTAIRG
jgi:hypothetical protein